MSNIFQEMVIPDKPRILRDERVFVYVPKAKDGAAGIASFNKRDFNLLDGEVSLSWPKEMEVTNLADPLVNVSSIKVLPDEFVNTRQISGVTNPTTKARYESLTAEVKLNRVGRDAFGRPDFVQLDNIADFESAQDPATGYTKYTLKRNDPLVQPSLIKLNPDEFKQKPNGISIKWPYAHDLESCRITGGYGLTQIATGGDVGLHYVGLQKLLDVNVPSVSFQMRPDYVVKPTYGATKDTGFLDIDKYLGTDGLAKNNGGGQLVAITKEAVGLSKVKNKAFEEYQYNELSQGIRTHLETSFDSKLNKSIWDRLFSDWAPLSVEKDTPQKWFGELEKEDDSIRKTLETLKLFLGYFENLSALTALHKPDKITYGSTAFLLDRSTYYAVRTSNVDQMFPSDAAAQAFVPPKKDGKWVYAQYITGSVVTHHRFLWSAKTEKYIPLPGDAIWLDYFLARDEDLAPFIADPTTVLKVGDRIGIRETNNIFVWDGTKATLIAEQVLYEWFDTGIRNLSFYDFVETQPSMIKPDGVASVGSSGKWVQSDHVHPTDVTKLNADIFKTTNLQINSEYAGDPKFKFNFYEQDAQGNYLPNRTVNIPYLRKTEYLHNWQGSAASFVDSQNRQDKYWAGNVNQFNAELANISNDTLMIVEDGDNLTPGNFVTEEQLDLQGIDIESLNPIDYFVTYKPKTVSCYDKVPVSCKMSYTPSGNPRIELNPIALNAFPYPYSNRVAVTKLVNGRDTNDGVTIDGQYLTDNQVVTSDNYGGITTSGYHKSNVITAGLSSTQVILPTGKVVISGASNAVSTYDTGAISGTILEANGTGGLRSRVTVTPNMMMTSAADGKIVESNLLTNNLIKTADGATVKVLDQNLLLKSGPGNSVVTTTFGNVANLPMVTLANGGIDKLAMPANRVLVSTASGQLSVLANTPNRYVGVDGGGIPTLMPIPTVPVIPTSLPASVVTANPTVDNVNGLMMCKLNGDPGAANYKAGVLYLW